ncbi:protein SIEVE ELEMENT OCCLUSION B-like [Carya illinoinensis]|uniref:protein SIEVE ELEMENT OCCLUSION B-like n=1 Tax=Carya illinoinensis TaxID=32201 RepID=UPI001C720E58|nr:protein SIEVE ELEMENT OCCLUSION B-like [Carya illinoinensis]
MSVVELEIDRVEQSNCGVLLNELSMFDDLILNQIRETHVFGAIETLFLTKTFLALIKGAIESFLYLATHIVDNALPGTGGQENLELPTVLTSGDLSLLPGILDQLSTVLRRRALCRETELRNTSMFILRNNLSSYSWTEKAVLILTAFVVDYGEFWALVKLQLFNRLVESMGVTKREPTTINCPDLKKCVKEIGDVSYLIKDKLEAIKCIIDFERLSNWADTNGNKVALSTTVKDSIPLHVYWKVDEDYTFLYGSTNNGWKEQFLAQVTNIICDLSINHPKISIRTQDALKLSRGKLKAIHAEALQSLFKSDLGYVELRKDARIIVGDYGTTIVKVLEKFDDWKGSLNQFGFGDHFKDYYDGNFKKN